MGVFYHLEVYVLLIYFEEVVYSVPDQLDLLLHVLRVFEVEQDFTVYALPLLLHDSVEVSDFDQGAEDDIVHFEHILIENIVMQVITKESETEHFVYLERTHVGEEFELRGTEGRLPLEDHIEHGVVEGVFLKVGEVTAHLTVVEPL